MPGTPPAPARQAQSRRPPHRIARVWGLNVALAGVVAAAFAAFVADHAPISEPVVHWYWVAAAIAVCERWPVALQFRRSTHAFSLTDIPLTLALIFASGTDAVAGVAAGTCAALVSRGLPPVKVAFNVVQFSLAACLGLAVLETVAGPSLQFGPRVWIGAFLATQLGGVLTIALIACVIWITERRPSRSDVREMFGMDAVVTLTNTSLALLAAVVLVSAPQATPILLVPVLVAFFGYRAFVTARERHEKLELLYETNRTFASSEEVTDALEGLLERAREAFRVEQAEVVLLGDAGQPALRTRLGPELECYRREPVDADAALALQALAAHGATAVPLPLPPALDPLLGDRRLREAVVTVLRGQDGIIGTMLLANRVGIGRSFDHDDFVLLESLATSASSALQDDRLEVAVSELRDLQHQLHHQTFHDALTGLPNRTLLTREAKAALARDDDVAVLFVDLDDFKSVNDTLGHTAGDQLLCAAATRIGRTVRAGDLVARLGGDEFAVLLRGDGGDLASAAEELAQRVLNAFDLPVPLAERLVSVSLSVGVATARDCGGDADVLLRHADMAMYAAKDAGKARWAICTAEMRDVFVRRHALREELAAAIAREELVVQYQPVVDISTRELVAVEALVRWDHPQHGRIPPLEFIPLAEETGLIIGLGRVVLRRACEQATAWIKAGNPPIDVQVNLSARELDDPDLVGHVASILRTTGLPPQRLVLELTETALAGDIRYGGARIDQLRALGLRLALDDFGTGYSSLSYLRSLPLDVLKIAKEFIDGIGESEEDATFVRLIVQLAAQLGLSVIAEGIETPSQHEALRELGCDLGQGYLFDRPLDGGDPKLAARRATPAAAH